MRAVPWTRFAMAIVLTTLLSCSSALAAPECSERDEMKILDVDLDVNGEHTVVPAGLALFGGDVVVNSAAGSVVPRPPSEWGIRVFEFIYRYEHDR